MFGKSVWRNVNWKRVNVIGEVILAGNGSGILPVTLILFVGL